MTSPGVLDRTVSPPLGLLPPNTCPSLYPSTVNYFSSIPWTATLLKQQNGTSASISAIPFIPSCRNAVSDEGCQLFSQTFASPGTINHILCFFHPEDEKHICDPARPIKKVSTLFALGDGLSGFPGVLHGGAIMAIVDQAIAVLNELNTALHKSGLVYKGESVTASLDIKFIHAIPSKGEVCVTVWLDGVEGRKTKFRCVIKDKNSVELARCSSNWVSIRCKV